MSSNGANVHDKILLVTPEVSKWFVDLRELLVVNNSFHRCMMPSSVRSQTFVLFWINIIGAIYHDDIAVGTQFWIVILHGASEIFHAFLIIQISFSNSVLTDSFFEACMLLPGELSFFEVRESDRHDDGVVLQQVSTEL